MNPSTQELIRYAESFLGCYYRFGGKVPATGLDCSGLACEVLRGFGMLGFREELSAQELYNKFSTCPKAIDAGALLFFGADRNSIVHVSIASSQYSMIESAGGDNTVLTEDLALKMDARVRRRGIHSRIDLFSCIMPKYPWNP